MKLEIIDINKGECPVIIMNKQEWENYSAWLKQIACGCGNHGGNSNDKECFENLASACGDMEMTAELSLWYDEYARCVYMDGGSC